LPSPLAGGRARIRPTPAVKDAFGTASGACGVLDSGTRSV